MLIQKEMLRLLGESTPVPVLHLFEAYVSRPRQGWCGEEDGALPAAVAAAPEVARRCETVSPTGDWPIYPSSSDHMELQTTGRSGQMVEILQGVNGQGPCSSASAYDTDVF